MNLLQFVFLTMSSMCAANKLRSTACKKEYSTNPSITPSSAPPATVTPSSAPPAPVTPSSPPPSQSIITQEPVTSSPAPSRSRMSKGPVTKETVTKGPVGTVKQPLLDTILVQTNIIRQAHGLNTITWDASLAQVIQRYADTCPGGKHGGTSTLGYNKGWQNLASFIPRSGNEFSKNKGPAWTWYDDEETFYDYSTGKCNGRGDCGHFQIMMSPSVTGMGCGFSKCGGQDNLVWCNYVNPGGLKLVPKLLIKKADLAKNLAH